LFSVLSDDPDRRLTLICAPAGYGKSTLVAQRLAQSPLPSAWMTLEDGDNDPRSFFGLVVAALQSIDRDLAVATHAAIAEGGAVRSEAVIHRLVTELSATTRSFILVIDDYHVIHELAIHRAMELLVQHMPMTMQLVLISRTEPPLQLARLRVSGELRVVRRADLQFTEAEALQFYQECLGLDLAPSQVKVVQERTEGWAAGLMLVASALRGRSREQIERFVDNLLGYAEIGDHYLWEEVLQRQPDDVRSFLVCTSILNWLTAGLCNAVTGTADGAEMIRRCERDGLFIIGLEGRGSWYRYHNLFVDALREQLSRSATKAETDLLHRRASAWLAEHGQREEAIRHAIAGNAWDLAVPLLEDFCAALFERDDVAALRTWLQGLPPEVMATSPRLAFWLAWALGRTGRWTEAAKPLRIAEEAWATSDDRSGQGLALLWHASRMVYASDFVRAVEHAKRALNHLPMDQPAARIFALMAQGIASYFHGEPAAAEAAFSEVRTTIDAHGRLWLQPFEMTYFACVLAQQGKLFEATVLCRRVIQAAGEQPTELWMQAALHQLGNIYYEWGLLDDAERVFQKADDLAELSQALHWRSRIRIGLARVAWARGAVEEALDESERAIGFANQFGTLQLVRNARAEQARFWLAAGRLALARRWAGSCELDPFLPPEYERQVEYLTYSRLLIRDGRPDLALRVLQRIDRQAAEAGRDGERVEVQVLTALAKRTAGDTTAALQALRGALELGEKGGHVHSFVDEGEIMATLLRHAAVRIGHREYVQRLLTELGQSPPAQPRDPTGTLDAFSEREVEVLRLVATGLGNREISQRLFISEKTVKKHLSNILGKFGCANRTQAVDQGRRIGLI
jgi:LuxR family maltose regulon positive regulatory protein